MTDSAAGSPPRGVALTARDARFREDPDAVYDTLRSHAPWFRDEAYGRTLLTCHDDVHAALRHRQLGVDARKSAPDSYMRRVAGTGVSGGAGEAAYEPPLVLLDDPAHRRIRLLTGKAFTPRAIEAQRPRIAALAAELIAGFADEPEIDFIARYAGPLPTRVIAAMMGVPAADWADLKRWSEQILQGYDPERDADTQRRLREAYVAMSALFRDTVAARRRAPREDLVSALVRAQEDTDRLSDLEIISLCIQLLVAGNVTTTDLMGNGLQALLAHPEALARLRAEPARIGAAIEEMLRFDCPLTETARIALEDTELAGRPVRAGATLTLSLAAANHDPARFPDPHAFDITRDSGAHVAYGGGVHVCLGAPLARLEAEVCLQAFVTRFPALARGTAPAVRRRLPFFRGFEVLPVRLA